MNFRDWFKIKLDRLKGKKNDLFGMLDFPYEGTVTLKEVLAGRNYNTIGLEIPASYAALRKLDVDFGVFADLADSLVAQGKAVVPLEHSQFMDRQEILSMLINAFLPGRNPQNFLTDKVLKYGAGRGFSQEDQQSPKYQRRFALYKQAYAMLGRVKTQHDLGKECQALVDEGLAHIVKRISDSNPELVILGSDHALAVKDQLSKHAYIGAMVIPDSTLIRTPYEKMPV